MPSNEYGALQMPRETYEWVRDEAKSRGLTVAKFGQMLVTEYRRKTEKQKEKFCKKVPKDGFRRTLTDIDFKRDAKLIIDTVKGNDFMVTRTAKALTAMGYRVSPPAFQTLKLLCVALKAGQEAEEAMLLLEKKLDRISATASEVNRVLDTVVL